jgi:hypothetical protein
VQQTEVAFLTPPAPKTKSRFMNLQRQLTGARRVLANLRDPSVVRKFATLKRIREKLGWLEAFEGPLDQSKRAARVAARMVQNLH